MYTYDFHTYEYINTWMCVNLEVACKEFHQHSFIETPTWFCHVLLRTSLRTVKKSICTWKPEKKKNDDRVYGQLWAKRLNSPYVFCFSCGFLGVEVIEDSALMRIWLVARLNQATMRFRCDDLQMHFRYLTQLQDKCWQQITLRIVLPLVYRCL
jgi:hypothetical protein